MFAEVIEFFGSIVIVLLYFSNMFPCCSCSSTSGRMDLTQVPSMDEIEFPIKADEQPDTEEKLDSLASPKSYRRLRNSFYQQDIGNNDKSNTQVKTILDNVNDNDGQNQKSRKTHSKDRSKLIASEDDRNRNETTTECDEVSFPFTNYLLIRSLPMLCFVQVSNIYSFTQMSNIVTTGHSNTRSNEMCS